MDVFLVFALGTLAYTVVIFLKNLSAQQWGSAITQVVAWLAGIGGMFLLAATQFGGGISIAGTALDKLDSGSTVLVGLMVASLLSTLHEFKKAIDRTETAAVPEWLENKAEATKRTHLVLPDGIATPRAVDEARQTVASSRPTPTSG
jgi:hypothetical protein